jgi:hypothetical protein
VFSSFKIEFTLFQWREKNEKGVVCVNICLRVYQEVEESTRQGSHLFSFIKEG